jgi:hypothetical protein
MTARPKLRHGRYSRSCGGEATDRRTTSRPRNSGSRRDQLGGAKVVATLNFADGLNAAHAGASVWSSTFFATRTRSGVVDAYIFRVRPEVMRRKSASPGSAPVRSAGDVFVHGYTQRDGTYVPRQRVAAAEECSIENHLKPAGRRPLSATTVIGRENAQRPYWLRNCATISGSLTTRSTNLLSVSFMIRSRSFTSVSTPPPPPWSERTRSDSSFSTSIAPVGA